ncbi:MAG: phytanoyl-CoA dioxygenase family protein [Stellaceae bacterium]
MTIRNALVRAYALVRSASSAMWGMLCYGWRGEAGHKAWNAFLYLHCATNGRSTEILRQFMRWLRPAPAPIHRFASQLGTFDAGGLRDIADRIRRDGYYVFPQRLPESFCDEIVRSARATEGWARLKGNQLETVPTFDPDHPITPRYILPEVRVWQIPPYQRLIADPVFVNLSQSYFDAASALKEVSLWWSPAMDGKPDEDAAQLFHFDYDAAPIWLKFFIYLSDVTEETGPHVFVKGSHLLRQEKARAILDRGYVRIGDDEVRHAYGRENVVELAGKKGTVFAVDTMGFHKGKPPVSGHRVLAQLEYAMPLFVPSRSAPLPLPRQLEPTLAETRKTYAWAFARYPLIA